MENHLISFISEKISRIMENAECAFGTHSQWKFFRKTLLKNLNDIKREFEKVTERQGGK